MRNKGFLLFFTVFFFVCVLGVTVAAALVFYNFYDSAGFDGRWGHPVMTVILAQNAVFMISGVIMLVFVAMQKKENAAPAAAPPTYVPAVSKLVILDKTTGGVRAECLLTDKRTLVIGKNAHTDEYLKYAGDGSVMHEYAALNLERNYWYIEAVSELRNVGIRKDYDYVFRRLKIGTLYLIEPNDAIEIAGEKIVVK